MVRPRSRHGAPSHHRRRRFVALAPLCALALASAAVPCAAAPDTTIGASTDAPPPVARRASIDGHAFGSAIGVLQVNVAGGAGNGQINALAIGLGSSVTVATEQSLAAAAQRTSPPAPGSQRTRSAATLGSGAFANARGILQLNETAGSNNASVNAFGLSVHL